MSSGFAKGHVPWNKGIKCPEEIKKRISNKLKGKHPSDETKKKLSKSKIGNKCSLGRIGYWKGKKRPPFSEEHRIKTSKTCKGMKNRLGTHCSEETRIKMGDSRRGEKNGLWKGGITSLHGRVRTSPKYIVWRTEVFKRDEFTCKHCGQHGGDLEAHHKKKFSILVEEALKYLPLLDKYEACMQYNPLWEINNGLTLCVKCHNNTKE